MELKDLLELYKQGEYQKVIDESFKSDDYNAIFLRIRSMSALKQFDFALREYLVNENTLVLFNLDESIKLFIQLLVDLNFSRDQICNECLRYGTVFYSNGNKGKYFTDYLAKYFTNEERDAGFNSIIFRADETNYKECLRSHDLQKISSALNFINKQKEENFLFYVSAEKEVEDLIKEKHKFNLEYGYFFNHLVSNRSNVPLLFNKDGVIFRIVPSELFEVKKQSDYYFRHTMNWIYKYETDAIMHEYELRLIYTAYFLLGPQYLKTKKDEYSFLHAAYYLTTCFYHKPFDGLTKFNPKVRADMNKVDYYIKLIKKACTDYNDPLLQTAD